MARSNANWKPICELLDDYAAFELEGIGLYSNPKCTLDSRINGKDFVKLHLGRVVKHRSMLERVPDVVYTPCSKARLLHLGFESARSKVEWEKTYTVWLSGLGYKITAAVQRVKAKTNRKALLDKSGDLDEIKLALPLDIRRLVGEYALYDAAAVMSLMYDLKGDLTLAVRLTGKLEVVMQSPRFEIK